MLQLGLLQWEVKVPGRQRCLNNTETQWIKLVNVIFTQSSFSLFVAIQGRHLGGLAGEQGRHLGVGQAGI